MRKFSWIFSALFLIGINAVIVWNALFNQSSASQNLAMQKPATVSKNVTVDKKPAVKNPVAKKPARDELVFKMQTQLAKQGIYTLEPDGVYGIETRKAIARYQRVAGLKVDGKPSNYLLNHMFISSNSLGKKMAQQKPQKVVYNAPTNLMNNVKRVQIGLEELGYDPGPSDGLIGKKTRLAIRQFEKDNKLAVTGKISRTLIKKLDEVTGTSRLDRT